MRTFIVSLTLVMPSFLAAQNEDLKKHQIPPAMYEFMGQMFRLQPFMFSQKQFMDPKNDKTIREGLTHLREISKRLPHSKRLDTTTFQVSLQGMQRHLEDLESTYSRGRKEFARRMLVATLDGCSSCHTQVPGQNLPGWSFKSQELGGNSYERAEFLFAVRHYREALENYNEFIRTFKPDAEDHIPLETAIRRKLVIYVRILKDLQGAQGAMKKDLQMKAIPRHLKADVQGWIRGLEKLQKTPVPNAEKADLKSIETYAKGVIEPLLQKDGLRFNPEAFVQLLQASGIIYDFTNHSGKTSPQLLYYLAIAESSIAKGYFFSMADKYLKECIYKFPSDPLARKCYNELESITIEDYTGSAGVDFPPDVKDELERLRKMLRSEGPQKL